jgi:hypothetical protein
MMFSVPISSPACNSSDPSSSGCAGRVEGCGRAGSRRAANHIPSPPRDLLAAQVKMVNIMYNGAWEIRGSTADQGGKC